MNADPAERSWLGGLGLVIATVGLVLPTGTVGAATGLGLILAWFAVSIEVAFALGQLALVWLGPDTGPAFALAHLGLIAVLAGALLRTERPMRTAAGFALAAAGLVGLAWLTHRTTASVPLAAGLLVGAAGLALYITHRYQRVRLGLESPPGDRS